jgi:hypothetical protein
MKNGIRKFSLILGLAFVVDFAGFLVYLFDRMLGTNKDFWDILGPVATCAATLVALFFGVGQEYVRWSAVSATARIVAAKLVPQLGAILDAIGMIEPQLERFDNDWMRLLNPGQQFAEIRSTGNLAALDVSMSELASLSSLPDDCAVRLARAIAILALINKSIADWEISPWPAGATDDDRRQRVRKWSLGVREARTLIDSALDTCEKASRGLVGEPARGQSRQLNHGDITRES